MKKRILAIIMVAALCVSAFTVAALADKDSASSGTCGSGITWEYDGEGSLTIDGDGDLSAWGDFSDSVAPWIDSAGNNACEKAENITLGENITGMTDEVLNSLPSATNLYVSSDEQLADCTFEEYGESLLISVNGADAVPAAEYIASLSEEETTEEASEDASQETSSEELTEGIYLCPVYYNGTTFYLYTGDIDTENLESSAFTTVMNAGVADEATETENEDTVVSTRVSVNAGSVQAGKSVSVTISIEDNPGAANLGFTVEYDSDNLELSSVTSSVKDMTFVSSDKENGSPLTLQWFSAENSTYSGTIATLKFNIAEDAELGDYDITVAPYEGINSDYVDGVNVNYNSEYEPLNMEYVDSYLTITDHLPGDIDSNGTVNSNDLTMLQKYLCGIEVEADESALDIDGNGSVDNKDATLLSCYLKDTTIAIH